MSARLTAFSSARNNVVEFRVYREGVIAAIVAATPVANQDYVYFADMPASLGPEGSYAFQLLRTSDGRQRATGSFYWDGTDIVYPESFPKPLTAAETTAATDVALTNYGTAKETTVVASQTAVLAAIAALNNLTAADIEAAFLNDGDGVAFRQALSQSVESALSNEADGNATIAVFQGAVAAALTAYSTAKQSDVTALNNLSQADVQTTVEDALVAYDGATSDEFAAGVASLSAQSLANKGLTIAQEATQQRLLDIAEADEVYTPTKAQKLLKGTATVLVDKDVVSDTECEVNTSLTEAP